MNDGITIVKGWLSFPDKMTRYGFLIFSPTLLIPHYFGKSINQGL